MPIVGYCRNLYSNLCACFVCGKKFSLDNGVEDLLTHICYTHRIIIENIDTIADFKKYMEYYNKRYREISYEKFTRQITIEVPENDSEPKEQKYYLLGDFLPEDENLRKNLHSKRLKVAQEQQIKDLGDDCFTRHCFYCHETLSATNAQLMNHLRCHGFQLGHPEKLVYIDKFLETIEDTFRTLHCLYCNLKFDSCGILIVHMEEKNHMKIHPNNRFYDQFYMINYLEFGKTWMDYAKEKYKVESEQDNNTVGDDADWSCWGTVPESIICLFCRHVCKSWDGTLLHMIVSHNFDFKVNVAHFNFYHQVKVVNYIRRRILNNECITCESHFNDNDSALTHMERSNHLCIPNKDCWNHSDYFFCTMENDMFLYHLEDQDDDNDDAMEERNNILCEYENVNRKSDIVGSSNELRVDRIQDSNSSTDSVGDKYEINYNRNTKIKLEDCEIVNYEKSNKNKEGIDNVTCEFDNNTEIIEIKCKNVKHIKKDDEIKTNHIGGGDSTKKIDNQDVMSKQINEFGDAGTVK